MSKTSPIKNQEDKKKNKCIREKVRPLEGCSMRRKGGLICNLNCTSDEERVINPLFLVTLEGKAKTNLIGKFSTVLAILNCLCRFL